jgi:hypothetical protein
MPLQTSTGPRGNSAKESSLNVKRVGSIGLTALFLVWAVIALVGVAQAAKIDPSNFDDPTIINFESAPPGPVGSFYRELGVSVKNLGTGLSYDTGTGNGRSRAACNFLGAPLGPPPGPPPGYTPGPPPGYTPGPPPGYTPGPPPGYTPGPPPGYTPGPPPGYTSPPPPPPGELFFDRPVDRVGFYIASDNGATTTVTAYLDDSSVGSESYATSGQGATGSFIGVEFAGSFDRLVILSEATVAYRGGFCIDDLRFEEGGANPAVVVIRPPSTGDGGTK